MQVESASYGIHVEYFAGEEQSLAHLAFERMQVDRRQRHATARHEFVTSLAASLNLIYIIGQRLDDAVDALLAQFAPSMLKRVSRAMYNVVPQSGRDVERTHRSQLFLRVAGSNASNLLLSHRASALTRPVYSYRRLILPLVQMACSVRRQLQCSRSAHSPVGDEQRPLGTHLRTWYRSYHRLHHRSHQFKEVAVLDVEREERRHRLFNLVAQHGVHLQPFALRTASRSDCYAVEVALQSVGKTQVQRPVVVAGDTVKAVACLLLYAQSCGKSHEAVDDAVRVLRLRKHALVLLRGKSHTLAFKPFVGAAMVKPLEQPLHQFVSARISMLHVAYLSKRIGKVAASAARDFHLGEHLGRLLEDCDVGRRAVAFCFDCSKVARRSATNNSNGHIFELRVTN